ncbi:MAG: hypothetical protein QGG40_21900, partial [Myxococcota bacterium]|nr:hypothetical protein [Myxococcota bacterium]
MSLGASPSPLHRRILLAGVLLLGLFWVGCGGKETGDPSSEVETCETSSDTCGPNTTCVDLEPGTFEGTTGFTCPCLTGFVP